MEQEQKMTEQEFIAKFKELGFELYETKSLAPKIRKYHKVEEVMASDQSEHQ